MVSAAPATSHRNKFLGIPFDVKEDNSENIEGVGDDDDRGRKPTILLAMMMIVNRKPTIFLVNGLVQLNFMSNHPERNSIPAKCILNQCHQHHHKSTSSSTK